jgi:branched-chain amino acid transport system permease protein
MNMVSTANVRLPFITLLVGLLGFFALPDQAALMTKVIVSALFVLSLDLVVGIAGLATLGHAAMFGVGAYAAGVFALKVHPDPLIGLIVATALGGLTALISGAFLLRYHGFTFLMLTVAVAQILLSIANKWRDVTGGDDGLSGFVMGPLLGRFVFDLEGRVAMLYSLAIALCDHLWAYQYEVFMKIVRAWQR